MSRPLSSRMARGYEPASVGRPGGAASSDTLPRLPRVPTRAGAGDWTRAAARDHAWGVMNVLQVYDDGLCMQCGTCVAVCPAAAVRLDWDLRAGHRLSVDGGLCTDCGACVEACPGPGLDFTTGAWWRERNAGAPARDFLGPWRGLWFGWASDPQVRHAGASGGVATALLAGALESGFADAVSGGGPRPGQSSRRGRRRLPDARGGGRVSRLQVQRRRREHAACAQCSTSRGATSWSACPATSRGFGSRSAAPAACASASSSAWASSAA